MLGGLIIGAAGVRQQQIEQVTSAHALGPLVVTPADRARAMAAAGLAEEDAPVVPAPAAMPATAPPPDESLSVREVQQLLRENPTAVRDVVQAEASRPGQGLEIRVSVLRLCLASAKSQGLDALVAAIETAIEAATVTD